MSFKRLDPEDISISAESVVAPAWSGQLTTLSGTTMFTQSSQTNIGAGNYYYDIYNQDPLVSPTTAVAQFSLAFGNIAGSGSAPIGSVAGYSPSSITYGQYRTLINGDENTNFTFGTVTPQSIYVIAINRSRYKEKLLPGSFNITLTSGSTTINLTDNSRSTTTVSYVDAGRVYDIVSGSDGLPYNTGTGFSPNSGSYGKFLPDIGTIILNGDAMGWNVDTGSTTSANNLRTLYNAVKTGGSFKLQSEETVSSNYVFIRVRNSEYNYSTNPSIITGSGQLRYDVLINTPQSYITTVGLYNDNNDLLGVAKLSRPLLKDFTKEALVRIKLDY